MPKLPQSRIDANVRYNRSRDQLVLRPDKDTGARIRAAAAAAGQPLQRYILDAVLSRMAADQQGRD